MKSHIMFTVFLILAANSANAQVEGEIKEQKLKIIKVTTLEKKTEKEKEYLERENAKLLRELEALKAKLPVLEDNLKSLEGVVKAGREENTRSRETLEDLKKQKAGMQEKIGKLTKERAELKESYSKTVAGTLIEEKQVKERKIELEKQDILTRDEQGRLEKETEKLKKELAAIQAQSDAKESALNKSKDILKNTKNVLADLKEKKENFLRNISDADEGRRKASEDTNEVAKEIAKLKAEISNLKIRADVAKHNQNDAHNAYKAIAKEAAQLKEINNAETTKLKKTEEEVIDLQGMIKTGKEEIDRAKKEYDLLIKRGQKAKTDKPRLEAHLAQLKINYNTLIEKNKQLRQKL